MDANDVLALGLGVTPPWRLVSQRLDTATQPNQLHLEVAAARIIGVTDQRLWRIVEHYVTQAVTRLDLSRLKAISLDETAAKRGQTYVTVFIDLDAKDKPVVFVTPGRGLPRRARRPALAHRRGRLRHEWRLPRRRRRDLRGRRRHRRLVPRRPDVHQGGR